MNIESEFQNVLVHLLKGRKVEYNSVMKLFSQEDLDIDSAINEAVFAIVSNPDTERFKQTCLLLRGSPFKIVVNPLNIEECYPSMNNHFEENVYSETVRFHTIIEGFKNVLSIQSTYPEVWMERMKGLCYAYVTTMSSGNDALNILPYCFLDLIPQEWFEMSAQNLGNQDPDKVNVVGMMLTQLTQLIGQNELLSHKLLTLLDLYIKLIEIEQVREFAQTMPNWMPKMGNDADGNAFQMNCHLGPILGITPFYDDLGAYDDPSRSIPEQSLIISSLSNLWDKQTQIIRIFLKPNTRNNTCRFLNQCLSVNMKRGGLQYDIDKVSGHGFVTNLNAVLQKLVEEVNLDGVDINYLNREATSENTASIGRLLSDETRIAADKNNLLNFSQTLISRDVYTEPNLHTQCFYWGVVSHNLSVISIWNRLGEDTDKLEYLEEKRNELQQYMEHSIIDLSPELEEELFDLDEDIEQLQLKIMSYENVLLDESYIKLALNFYEMVAIFVLKNSTLVETFKYLPQFIFENIMEVFTMVVRSRDSLEQELDLYDYESLIHLIIYVIDHWHNFQSPYLVSKFVKVFSAIFSHFINNEDQNLELHFKYGILIGDIFIKNLIQYYNFIEKTGTDTEFYDKFDIRRDISMILIVYWNQAPSFTNLDNDTMIQFIYLISNDVTYLVDEVLDFIRKLRIAQQKAKVFDTLSQTDQDILDQDLAQYEIIIPSHILLLESFVQVLTHLSQHCPAIFMNEEIVHKFASMLNHIICDFVGPKYSELKINEPAIYKWDHRQPVGLFMKIYCNLNCDTFVQAISKEERYFSEQTLTYIVDFIECRNFPFPDIIGTFISMVTKAREMREKRNVEESDWDDVPMNYLDPILSTIMTDPVLLPHSNIIIDKSVIKRHLLNDACDPFNRQPLKFEDLIPLPDLKADIIKWVAQKREKRN